MLTGSCHCGTTKFEVDGEISETLPVNELCVAVVDKFDARPET